MYMSYSAGTLDECRNLTITSLGTYHQSLTWDPPPTLNITAVEPDISGYVVCDNIRTQCTHIDTREAGGDSHNMLQYVFPNVRTGVNFTVTAVNIVGDGEVSSVVYQQCQSSDECKFIPCIALSAAYVYQPPTP